MFQKIIKFNYRTKKSLNLHKVRAPKNIHGISYIFYIFHYIKNFVSFFIIKHFITRVIKIYFYIPKENTFETHIYIQFENVIQSISRKLDKNGKSLMYKVTRTFFLFIKI